jgi:hypothetical protein
VGKFAGEETRDVENRKGRSMEGGRLDTWGEVPQLTNWQLENRAVRIGCMGKEFWGGASDATTCISAHRDELVPREASWNIGLRWG